VTDNHACLVYAECRLRNRRTVDGGECRRKATGQYEGGAVRTFAWISRNRRLGRDFERYATTVAAFVRLAMIRIMLKRLTKPTLCS
jgi:hypothetical protein